MTIEEEVYARQLELLFKIEAMIEIGWKPGIDDLVPDEWRRLLIIKQERNQIELKRIKKGNK